MPAPLAALPRDRGAVVVMALLVAGTAAVALAREPVMLLLWSLMWALAATSVWPDWRRAPFYLWAASAWLYPQASDRFSSLNEFATVNGTLLLAVGVSSVGAAAYVLRRHAGAAFVMVVWPLWGLLVYLPVFFGWAMRVAGVADAVFGGLYLDSSALKTAGPVLLAWTPVVGAVAAIRTPEHVRRFLQFLMIATLAFAGLSLLQLAISGFQGSWVPVTYSILPGRLHSISSPDANSTARQALPSLVLLLPAAILARRHRSPRLLWPALVLAGVVMLLTMSRTALVSSSVAVLVIVLAEIRRRRTVLVAGGLATGLVVALAGAALSGAIRADRLTLDSLSGRFELYEVVGKVIWSHPLLGVRPGGYPAALAAAGHPGLISPHNMWFGVAAEWGLPMALWLTAALVMTGVLSLDGLLRLRRLPRTAEGSLETRILLVGAAALAATWLVHGLSEIVPPESVFLALGLATTARCRLVPAVVRTATASPMGHR